MKYLFGDWKNLGNYIRDKEIILFLDYDGTLTKIRNKPGQAVISKKAKDILRSLLSVGNYKIAVISGRSLKDIIKMVGLRGIIYSGNHGLQIKGPGINFSVPIPKNYKIILKSIKKNLNQMVSLYKGALIEDKGLSLSLHYRLVDNKYIKKLKRAFRSIIKRYLLMQKVKLKEGKMVLEIVPPVSWDKGKVIFWLLFQKFKQKELFPVYIGDDKTDEDAFRVLRGKGLTIFVGRPKRLSAQYYVRDVDEVMLFLRNLLKIKKDV